MFGKKEIESLRAEIEAKNAEIEKLKARMEDRVARALEDRREAEERANIAENEIGKWREKWRDAENRRIHAYHAAERFKKKR